MNKEFNKTLISEKKIQYANLNDDMIYKSLVDINSQNTDTNFEYFNLGKLNEHISSITMVLDTEELRKKQLTKKFNER